MAEDTQRTKSLNSAADLAESQLARAVQIARSAGFEADTVVRAAVLQAVVVNHWKFMR
jgi:hypothetical protein